MFQNTTGSHTGSEMAVHCAIHSAEIGLDNEE